MLKKKLISDNPFHDFTFSPLINKTKKTIQNGTLEDIILQIRGTPNRYKPDWFWIRVSRFLYVTGIRRRQLTHIQWDHIDFKEKTLLITAMSSKNYKERKIPLCDIAISDLNFILKKHRKTSKSDLSSQVFNVTLFNDKYKGTITTVGQVSGFYKRLKKNTGIHVSPHRFRHTMATELGKIPNINILALSDILGHTDIRVTRQYVETDLRPQLNLLEKLEENLTKSDKCSK